MVHVLKNVDQIEIAEIIKSAAEMGVVEYVQNQGFDSQGKQSINSLLKPIFETLFEWYWMIKHKFSINKRYSVDNVAILLWKQNKCYCCYCTG